MSRAVLTAAQRSNGECTQCLKMRFTMPVRMNCMGHRFTEALCLECRLGLNMDVLLGASTHIEREDGRALLPRRYMTSPAALEPGRAALAPSAESRCDEIPSQP
jgi:hypothetical protein